MVVVVVNPPAFLILFLAPPPPILTAFPPPPSVPLSYTEFKSTVVKAINNQIIKFTMSVVVVVVVGGILRFSLVDLR